MAKEEAEIAVIETFLPQQMDEAAMEQAVADGDCRDRRRQHQGHGQGDGGAAGQARRDTRHGEGGSDGEGQAIVMPKPEGPAHSPPLAGGGRERGQMN